MYVINEMENKEILAFGWVFVRFELTVLFLFTVPYTRLIHFAITSIFIQSCSIYSFVSTVYQLETFIGTTLRVIFTFYLDLL